jgi:hypothetical protein
MWLIAKMGELAPDILLEIMIVNAQNGGRETTAKQVGSYLFP